MILVLDTSLVEASTVALIDATASELLGEREYPRPDGGSALLLEGVSRLLQETDGDLDDLTGIVVNRGPGSYTGLRIGFALAQGLSEKRRIPTAAVPSFQAFAAGCREGLSPLVVCYDARSRGLAFVAFPEGAPKATHSADEAVPRAPAITGKTLQIGQGGVMVRIAPAAALPGLVPRPCRIVGPGVAILIEQLGDEVPADLDLVETSHRPDPLQLARLALPVLQREGDDLLAIDPYYLGTMTETHSGS